MVADQGRQQINRRLRTRGPYQLDELAGLEVWVAHEVHCLGDKSERNRRDWTRISVESEVLVGMSAGDQRCQRRCGDRYPEILIDEPPRVVRREDVIGDLAIVAERNLIGFLGRLDPAHRREPVELDHDVVAPQNRHLVPAVE